MIQPFNNRLLITEVKEKEQKSGSIFVPDFVKERKEIPKFIRVQINNISPNLSPQFDYLLGMDAIIETGFLEEVNIDNITYRFCPVSYVVAVITPE